jgi:hypothetical protein
MQTYIEEASREIKIIEAVLAEHGGNVRTAIEVLLNSPEFALDESSFQKCLGEIALAELYDLLPELEISSEVYEQMETAIRSNSPERIMNVILQNIALLESEKLRSLFKKILESYLFSRNYNGLKDSGVKDIVVGTEGVVLKIQRSREHQNLPIMETVKDLAQVLGFFSLGRISVQGVDEAGDNMGEPHNGVQDVEEIAHQTGYAVRIIQRQRREMIATIWQECRKHPDPYRILGRVLNGLPESEQVEFVAMATTEGWTIDGRTFLFGKHRVTYGIQWELLEMKKTGESSA